MGGKLLYERLNGGKQLDLHNFVPIISTQYHSTGLFTCLYGKGQTNHGVHVPFGHRVCLDSFPVDRSGGVTMIITDVKNSEGYTDYTAFAAGRRVSIEERRNSFKAGEVYALTDSKGKVWDFFVLASFDTFLTGFLVFDVKPSTMTREGALRIVYGADISDAGWIDCARPIYGFYSAMGCKRGEVDGDTLEAVRARIALALGLGRAIPTPSGEGEALERVIEEKIRVEGERDAYKDAFNQLTKALSDKTEDLAE